MSPPRHGQIDLAAAVRDEMETPQPAGGETAQPRPAPERTRPTRRARHRAAEEVITPRPARVQREPLNIDVPVELGLRTRMHLYRIQEGVDVRDQAAYAIDAWLRERGY